MKHSWSRILAPIGVFIILLIATRACAQLSSDDYDPFYPLACGSNSNHNASGCSSFGTSLYTFLAGESAQERTEAGLVNFVVTGCLGATAAGLTHTPSACTAYNINLRGTETSAITYPNNSVCWVAMDENRTGANAGLPNFARVTNAHYLTDCVDANTPSVPADAQLLMRVVTQGGSIINVQDLRNFSPFTPPLNGFNALVNTIACTGPDCTIKQFSVNDVQNPASPHYGAVSSTVTILCSATQGSASILCSGTGDFIAGQNITLNHAGATPTVVAPTPTVTSSQWNTAKNGDIADGTGATGATYLIGALDGKGGIVMAASTVSIANSQATLSFSAFNKIAFTPATGGAGTVVCGCVGNSCTPTLLAIVPQNQNFYYDMGVATSGTQFGTTLDTVCNPAAAFNDNDNDTILTVSNGNPTALTHTAPNTANNQTLFHDNSVSINAALNAICANGGEVYLPAGTYPIGQTVEPSNCKGIEFRGAGNSQNKGSTLDWYGGLGGTAFKVFCIADSGFSDFSITDLNGNTPSYGLQSSNVGCTLTNNTNIDFENISIDESGYGFYISDGVNNSPLSLRQVKFYNGGIANLAISNGQSKNNQYWGQEEARRLYGTYITTGGDQYFYNKQGNGWIMDWLGTTANIYEFGGEAEQPARYLVTAGPTGGSGTVAFYGSHLQMAPSRLQPDGIAFSDSLNAPLILDGVDFLGGGGLPQTAFGIYTNRVGASGVAAVISRGNAYPNQTPFQYVATNNSVFSVGDTGSSGSANVALATLLGTLAYYSAAGTGLPTCSSLYARTAYCVSDEFPSGGDTTCNGPSTMGTTYASGGTLKCQVQCATNGSAWKVTGVPCF